MNENDQDQESSALDPAAETNSNETVADPFNSDDVSDADDTGTDTGEPAPEPEETGTAVTEPSPPAITEPSPPATTEPSPPAITEPVIVPMTPTALAPTEKEPSWKLAVGTAALTYASLWVIGFFIGVIALLVTASTGLDLITNPDASFETWAALIVGFIALVLLIVPVTLFLGAVILRAILSGLSDGRWKLGYRHAVAAMAASIAGSILGFIFDAGLGGVSLGMFSVLGSIGASAATLRIFARPGSSS